MLEVPLEQIRTLTIQVSIEKYSLDQDCVEEELLEVLLHKPESIERAGYHLVVSCNKGMYTAALNKSKN